MAERVSVIIPCYNRGDYIAETVDSVLHQTFQDFVLYVVDDGSTDNTRAILESYGDKVQILEHEGRVNKGQSAAINVGLNSSEGEFVAILDSDDVWYPNKLAEQVEFLDNHADIGLVYGNGIGMNAKGDKLYDLYPSGHVERNRAEDVLLNCYFLLPNNAMVRRRCVDEAGRFDESLRAAQDHDMAIRIAEVTNLAYVDLPWLMYRRHEQSISKKNADLRWQNGFKILDKAAHRYPYSTSVIRKRKAVLYFRLAQCALERRQRIPAVANLLRSGALDPMRALRVVFGRERVTSPH